MWQKSWDSKFSGARVKEHLDDCFSGNFVQHEMTYRYPKLGERELRVEYLPIQGPGGIDRVASLKRDLTDRKKADQALRLFRALIEQSNDGRSGRSDYTPLLRWERQGLQEFRYTREELLATI